MATNPKDALESAAAEAPAGALASPMMAQYLAIKRAHADYLLFYRMGDFYELFFDDAVKASAALDITLTRRGRHDGDDIPMCGVPVHAADAYLARLIRKGFRVAVCEQVEDPAEAKRRGGKSVVAREVVRIVTPGTLTEDTLLDARRNNYLAALAEVRDEFGLAWLDISTGAFCVETVPRSGIGAAIARLGPGEILVPERFAGASGPDPAGLDSAHVPGEFAALVTPQPGHRFDSDAGRRRLEALYAVRALDGFGSFTRAELAACGALVGYVELTQKGRLPHLAPPRRIAAGSAMEIDGATRRNLEIVESLAGADGPTLLSTVDRTVTGAGCRLLAGRLTAPLTGVDAIRDRLDMVEFFVADPDARRDVRASLKGTPDLERALSRLTLGRGGPRDLGAVRAALEAGHRIRVRVDGDVAGATPPPGIVACAEGLGDHAALVGRLALALSPVLPMLARDGGFVAAGYSAELDGERALRDDSRRLVTQLQRRYAEETGIASLKVRHNNVLGYFVEATAAHAEKLGRGGDGRFIHRQTLASAMRFTTAELGELETRINQAADKALALEAAIFDELLGAVAAAAAAIARAAAALADLDVAAAWAELAVGGRYVRPVVDDSRAFEIAGGRHPVVEAALAPGSSHGRAGAFVPNDCDLPPEARLWLVTGPNMAGKSTFLRQNALIAILAQTGSFVPADAAHVGVVDRLFSRVGAADDLARGRSTFMVEMVETAAILNQAGERALVILDEIGRGTATFDGLSIAWAALEHLHEVNRCRALFATHFHELTALAARLAALRCHTMRVKEWKGEVVFLHEVASGAADRSYGIHVAKLAGLPAAVIARADEVLKTLEQGEQSGGLVGLAEDLPLFAAALRPTRPAGPSAVEGALAEVNPDELTPKAALELLYRLKALASGS